MLEDAVKDCLIAGIIEKSGAEPETKEELIEYLMKLVKKRMTKTYIEVEPLRKFIVDRINSDDPNTALSYDATVILSYIDNAQSEEPQKWIPISERLPELFEDVIVYDAKNQEIRLAYITEDSWVGVRMNGKLTHWMPLPEAPEGR